MLEVNFLPLLGDREIFTLELCLLGIIAFLENTYCFLISLVWLIWFWPAVCYSLIVSNSRPLSTLSNICDSFVRNKFWFWTTRLPGCWTLLLVLLVRRYDDIFSVNVLLIISWPDFYRGLSKLCCRLFTLFSSPFDPPADKSIRFSAISRTFWDCPRTLGIFFSWDFKCGLFVLLALRLILNY